MINIEKEKEQHKSWYKQDDPIAYQQYRAGGHEFEQDFSQSEKSWLAAKAQAPYGFFILPLLITDEWMAVYVNHVVDEYCKYSENSPYSVKESELPALREHFQKKIRNAHHLLVVLLIEQGTNQCK